MNSDNEKKQNYSKNQHKKKAIDGINEQEMNLDEGSSMEQSSSETSNTADNFDVKSLADKVTNINILRNELDRLQLDFKARVYFENDVRPLIDTLYTLSNASDNFSTAASNLASTNFGSSSKIKDAIDLVQDVNEISEDLIEVLRCKVDNMLKLSKYDCK